jgi:hypothetical protein
VPAQEFFEGGVSRDHRFDGGRFAGEQDVLAERPAAGRIVGGGTRGDAHGDRRTRSA